MSLSTLVTRWGTRELLKPGPLKKNTTVATVTRIQYTGSDGTGYAALNGTVCRVYLLQGEPSQVLDGFGLGSAEEHRLSRGWQVLQDAVQLLSEAHIQYSVGLVQHQDLPRSIRPAPGGNGNRWGCELGCNKSPTS